jgi:hypothetical protein
MRLASTLYRQPKRDLSEGLMEQKQRDAVIWQHRRTRPRRCLARNGDTDITNLPASALRNLSLRVITKRPWQLGPWPQKRGETLGYMFSYRAPTQPL